MLCNESLTPSPTSTAQLLTIQYCTCAIVEEIHYCTKGRTIQYRYRCNQSATVEMR